MGWGWDPCICLICRAASVLKEYFLTAPFHFHKLLLCTSNYRVEGGGGYEATCTIDDGSTCL